MTVPDKDGLAVLITDAQADLRIAGSDAGLWVAGLELVRAYQRTDRDSGEVTETGWVLRNKDGNLFGVATTGSLEFLASGLAAALGADLEAFGWLLPGDDGVAWLDNGKHTEPVPET